MEIVLLQRIEKLGQMGDVVSVKDRYARNFPLPQGTALRAAQSHLLRLGTERAQPAVGRRRAPEPHDDP